MIVKGALNYPLLNAKIILTKTSLCTGSQIPDSACLIGGYYLLVKRSVLAGPVFDTPSDL